jgi:hypothetical protein
LQVYAACDRLSILKLDVGLLDQTWCKRLPPALAARLIEIIDERAREAWRLRPLAQNMADVPSAAKQALCANRSAAGCRAYMPERA